MPAFVLSASGSTPKDKCDFLCLRPFRAPQNGLANALYLQPAYKAADAQAPFGDAPDFSAENRINPCAAQKSIVREKKEKIFSVRKKRQNRLCPRRRTAAADEYNLEWTKLRAVSAPRRRCGAAGEGKPGCGRRGRGRIRDDRCSAASPPLWLRRKRANASRGRMTGRQDFFGKPARVPSCALPNAAAPVMPAFIAVSRQKPRRAHRAALWELTSPVRFGIIINILNEKGRLASIACVYRSWEHPLLTEGCKLPSPLRAPRADQNWETRRRRRCVRKYIRFAPQSAWKVF